MATAATATKPATQQTAGLQEAPKPTMSERFTTKVLKEFGSNVVGAIQVTDSVILV